LKITRAAFLQTSSLAFIGALSGTAEASPFSRVKAEKATASYYRPFVNQMFRVSTDEGTVPLVLARVIERPVSKGVEQFSLIFHAVPGESLRDGIHSLEHPTAGVVDLFLSPVGMPNSRRTAYQACFSRLV
jgi:hypothetical protein